jgi:4-hydroxybenzoate polyprenyltransferase
MFIALLQSLSLAGASWFLLNTANPQTLFENTLLSVAVFYSYWVSQKLHQAAYWLPLLVIAGTITLSPNVHSVLMLVVSLFTIAYFLQHKFSFRETPLLKNITVALCWSILIAIPDTTEIFQLGGSVFFTTLALSLCIDFVQRKEDEGKVETVPHIIGNNPTLFFSLIFVLIGHLFMPTSFYAGILALGIQAGLTYFPQEKQREALRELPFLAYALGIYLL